MKHDVFISYSSKDVAAASTVCQRLEQAGIRCWFAKNSLPPGGNWLNGISDGLRASKVVVLVFSAAADASMHVLKELTLAMDQGRPIVPFRLENVPAAKLEYVLAGTHRLDAFPGPIEDRVPHLTDAVRHHLTEPPNGAHQDGRVGDPPAGTGAKVALIYKRGRKDDEHVMRLLEGRLAAAAHNVFVDRHMPIGVPWGGELDHQIRTADAVVVLLSEASIHSEMVEYEVTLADQTRQTNNGKPRILPVRVGYTGELTDPIRAALAPLQYFPWTGPADDDKLVRELAAALAAPTRPQPLPPPRLEPDGGAVPLDAEFYVERETDNQVYQALDRRDAIVLIKGARQMGKTSLLARGVHRAREAGVRVAVTDLQKFGAAQMAAAEPFLTALGEYLADQLGLDASPQDAWNPKRSPYVNFERYIRREVLGQIEGPLVWCMDEADRLLTCPFGSEVFAQFRTWYNGRAYDPNAAWWRLTLAIAYATEPHLFIQDINQSPFNVGTRLELHDFTREQVADLNRRHRSPLEEGAELNRFHRLVGGQPFLVRRGLNEMAGRRMSLPDFEAQADQEGGPYGDHLRRMLVMLSGDARQCDVVRGLLAGRPCPDPDSFYRLRGLGLVAGNGAADARFRCRVYETYMRRHLVG